MYIYTYTRIVILVQKIHTHTSHTYYININKTIKQFLFFIPIFNIDTQHLMLYVSINLKQMH